MAQELEPFPALHGFCICAPALFPNLPEGLTVTRRQKQQHFATYSLCCPLKIYVSLRVMLVVCLWGLWCVSDVGVVLC